MIEVYYMGDMGFVDVGDGYLLCIGSRAEITKASPEVLWSMITEAIALSQFHSIESSKGKTVQ